MRVMVGSIAHESNTFTPLLTKWDDFQSSYGLDILAHPGRGSLGGIIATLQRKGYELVSTISTHALPGGVVEKHAFETMKKSLLAGADNVDAACIFLHGAMRAEGEDYADSALLSTLRNALGPKKPIVVAMDMHGNITTEMVKNANGIVMYRTAPHIDTYETGERAANLLVSILENGICPSIGFVKLPILMPGEMAQTAYEPMAGLMQMLAKIDAKPHMLSSSIAKIHCWADVYDQGVVALTISDGDSALAQAEANQLASTIWSKRTDFRATVETYPVDEAIDVALSAPQSTVFLSDSGDNPGAGGSTDVPFVIERLLAKGAENSVVAAIWDAEAFAICAQAGVGATVDLNIGGKVDYWHGKPLPVTGWVRLLSDGFYYEKGCRLPENLRGMGPMAVLSVRGVDIVISRRRVSIYDPEQLRILGIEPLAYKLVITKRGYLEPLFQAIAKRAILMLSPGATNCDVTQLEYKKVRRPIYPLDIDASWSL